MIVGKYFIGDGDCGIDVQWLQHGVYYQALGVVTDTCQRYVRLAYRIIDEHWEEWKFVDRYDHRTMQNSHDILAAVWRARHEYSLRQLELPLYDGADVMPDFMRHWLRWLQEEVSSWISEPGRVNLVMKILRNQNQTEGYQAEAALNWTLLMAYCDVPWLPRIVEARRNILIERGGTP